MSDSPLHLDENVSAAPGLSPGVVEDDEILLRELFKPHHVKNGQLRPAAISAKDLISAGFSVKRMRYVTAECVKASIEERLSRPRKGEPLRNEGVAKLKTLEVRQILFDDRRAFVVIDTAEPNNKGHASIYSATPEKGEPYARELRKLLLPFLQKRMPVDEAFEELEPPRPA